MSMRVWMVIAAVTLALGCKKDAASHMPKPPPGGYQCDSAEQCAVSGEILGDCCGHACSENDEVYHVDELAAIRDANRQTCPERPKCVMQQCIQVDFKWVATCRESKCVGLKVPREAEDPK